MSQLRRKENSIVSLNEAGKAQMKLQGYWDIPRDWSTNGGSNIVNQNQHSLPIGKGRVNNLMNNVCNNAGKISLNPR